MKQRSRATVLLWGTLLGCLVLCLTLTPLGWAQQSQGTVTVSVVDPTGSVIPGAKLTLVDVATNDSREATTQDAGNYTFVNLSFGSYKLTVVKDGFDTQTYNVLVQAARNTDVKATLKVGSTSQVVEVIGGAAPLVETTSSATNMTIDTKQIEDLPLGGRNIAQLSRLSAGYNGTWNGLPTMAQGSTMDGIVGSSGRWKYYAGADSTAVTPRLENIAEMTVSTDQLDLNQGFGTSNMQITYVTRRGTNDFHGRIYEDFRNDALFARPFRVTKKPKLILNEFGGSLGGPILKDKLFFFGSFSMSKQPGGKVLSNQYFNNTDGTFIFGPAGNRKQVNLFSIINAYNATNTPTLPNSVNTVIANRFKEIAGYRAAQGQLGDTPDDPNLSLWQWNQTNPVTYYYPTVRLDYNLSQNLRLNLAYNQTKMNSPGASNAWWPGDDREASNKSNGLTASLGLEWTISPTLINQFRAGYNYTAAWFGVGGSRGYETNPTVFWGYGDYEMSGMVYNMPNSRMQPVISFSNTTTWVKGPHTFSFGFNAYRDQNKYWDPPEGFPNLSLGLVDGDPALQALTEDTLTVDGVVPDDTELWRAQQIYSILTGRVTSIWGRKAYDPKTNAYSKGVAFSTLNELMKSWGLFAQDSYKIKRNLTLNYGLRWDFVGENKDLTGKYHSMTPNDLFGPSGEWNLFNPGVLKGTMDPVLSTRDHVYNGWNVTPQPAIGLAWTPRNDGNMIEKLLGGEKTVVRAGYALRRFTEPQQFVWDMASAYAAGFYQPFYSNADPSGQAGTFAPGSLQLGDPYPQFVYQPAQYEKTIHIREATFGDLNVAAIDPNIRQPYTQSWNFGIQRELGPTRAFEIRYNGNRTIHQWIAERTDEVNVFENGFLDEFKHAQANYALNHAAGVESFANMGRTGQYDLPIMTAAGVAFNSASFIRNLQYGQVGSMASTLTGANYFCNMVGNSFYPCSWAGAGAGYPVNFFVANPFATGAWMGAPYMTDRGFSNYHSLQAEFRQRYWHGITFNANYTWSKTLGVATGGDWMGGYRQVTIRNLKSAYGPASTDVQNMMHFNATYDLPFGKGKQWLNSGGIIDKALGGWTVSTIVTWQTGAPFRITGANNTFNNLIDGGIVLNGITPGDIQDHIGVYYNAQNNVRYLDPKWISEQLAKGAITSNTTPGTMGQMVYLHGPRRTYTDIGISKAANLTERMKFKFQAELLNAFNHPVFSTSGTSISSTSGFGSASQVGTYRRVEFRANLEF